MEPSHAAHSLCTSRASSHQLSGCDKTHFCHPSIALAVGRAFKHRKNSAVLHGRRWLIGIRAEMLGADPGERGSWDARSLLSIWLTVGPPEVVPNSAGHRQSDPVRALISSNY